MTVPRPSTVRLAATALLLVSAFALIGCSEHRPERDEQGRVIVRYMVWGRANEINELRQALAEKFEPANPHIKVELVWIAGDMYQTKLATMLAGGIAPDLFMVHNAFFPTLVKHNLAQPLDDYVARDPDVDLGDFLPEVVDLCYYKGRMYNLPVAFYSVMLFYNEEMFDRAGLEYPDDTWTWEDLLAASQALTLRDEDGRAIQFGLQGPTEWLSYLFFIWQNGGRVFDDEGRFVMGRPEYLDACTEAWRYLQDLAVEHRVVPSPSMTEALPADPFLSGKVAMHISGTWKLNQIVSHWSSARKTGDETIRWNLAPLPRGKHRVTLLGGGSPVMYRETKHPDEAWRVMKFFVSEAWQRHIAGNARETPTRRKVAWSEAYLRMEGVPERVNLGRILRSIEYARPQPRGIHVAEVMEQHIAELRDNIVAGRVTDIRAELVRLQQSFDDPNPYSPLYR